MAHSSLRNHNKLKDLAEFLDVPESHAVGLLVCLWWAVYDTKAIGPDGIMHGWAERHIARQAGWTGPPTAFINAMFEAVLLDRAPGGEWAVHDYSDWAPDYLKKRWQRAGWDGEKPILEPCEPYCPDNGRQRQTTAATDRECLPTQPNLTERNEGQRNQKEPKAVSCSSNDEPSVSRKQQAEEIYKAYPKATGGTKAKKKIAQVLKDGLVDYATLLAAVKAFAESDIGHRGDIAYCPGPIPWMNQERWADNPEMWKLPEDKWVRNAEAEQNPANEFDAQGRCPQVAAQDKQNEEGKRAWERTKRELEQEAQQNAG